MLPNLDTAFAFLIPKWKLIREGKGDDENALRQLSQRTSSGGTHSVKSSRIGSPAQSATNAIDVLSDENAKLKKRLAELERTATQKNVMIKETKESKE
jgi:hypothetical protein